MSIPFVLMHITKYSKKVIQYSLKNNPDIKYAEPASMVF